MTVFYWLFRFMLGLFFILYGINNLYQANDTKEKAMLHLGVMQKVIGQYVPQIKSLNFEEYKSKVFKIAQNVDLAYIYGGLLLAFGLSFGKTFTLIAVVLDAIMVASPRIYQDDFGFSTGMAYLALIGITAHA